MKLKTLFLSALAALSISSFAGEPPRSTQIYNTLESMAGFDTSHMPTTNATVNVGVTAGDGLGNDFYWDATSTAATNWNLIASTWTATGRWTRITTPAPLVAATISTTASYITDASKARIYQLNLSTNLTLGVPTNAINGQILTWEFVQDTNGSRTITLATNFLFSTNFTSITLTTNAGYRDIMQGIFDTNNYLIRVTDYKGKYL